MRARFPAVERFSIASSHVDQTFEIQVMTPLHAPDRAGPWPVVYAGDANLTFDMFRGISNLLQTAEETSPFILVGVGYPGDCPLAGAVLRGRDFTFPGYPELKVEPPAIEGVLAPRPGAKAFFGAEDFLAFLEHELMPEVERRHPAAPGERTWFGHSGGGGFGLFALLHASHLFRNHILSSPGLIFHGRSSAGVDYEDYDFALREFRAFVERGGRLDGRRLYMSVGTEEEFQEPLKEWRLTSSFYRMAALLRSAPAPGLEVVTEVLPGETHATTWPIAFIHGLKAVLGPARP